MQNTAIDISPLTNSNPFGISWHVHRYKKKTKPVNLGALEMNLCKIRYLPLGKGLQNGLNMNET